MPSPIWLIISKTSTHRGLICVWFWGNAVLPIIFGRVLSTGFCEGTDGNSSSLSITGEVDGNGNCEMAVPHWGGIGRRDWDDFIGLGADLGLATTGKGRGGNVADLCAIKPFEWWNEPSVVSLGWLDGGKDFAWGAWWEARDELEPSWGIFFLNLCCFMSSAAKLVDEYLLLSNNTPEEPLLRESSRGDRGRGLRGLFGGGVRLPDL